MKANAESYIVNNIIGDKLAACFMQTRLAGASLDAFNRIRQSVLTEAPVSLIAQLMKGACLSNALQQMAETVIAIKFTSRNDVDYVRSEISEAFAIAAEAAADEMESEIYRALVGLHAAVTFHLYETARPLPRMYNEWGNPWLDVLGNPVSGAALLWFRCGDGQCGIKPHLEFGEGEERELSEWPYWGLGPDTNRFYWTVHLEHGKIVWFRCASGQSGVDPHLIYIGPESRLIWFRCGVHQCGVDPLLFIRIADDLECLFNRWKPAHTHVLFDYSGLEQPGDPMGGTP